MNSLDSNPRITRFLRAFTLVEALVLTVVGFGLFIFPEFTRPQWAWKIAPFNARFLGAIYLGALVPVALMFISGRWSPTRPVLRAIFTFTLIVLVVSIFHRSQFDFSSPAVWAWFVLYVALPASGGYHLWLYRSMRSSQLKTVAPGWRIALNGTGILLGIYGLGLIVFPSFFSSLFPWKLDVFHSQLYSATFITGCVMLLSVSSVATRAEFIVAGLTEATFSIFSIAGLFIVDVVVKKIDWFAANTISWLASLAVLALLGIAMMITGIRQQR